MGTVCPLLQITLNQLEPIKYISRLVIFNSEFSLALTLIFKYVYIKMFPLTLLHLNRINALCANGGSRFTFGANDIRF